MEQITHSPVLYVERHSASMSEQTGWNVSKTMAERKSG